MSQNRLRSRKKNYGILRNVRPPIIDTHSHVVCGKDVDSVENPERGLGGGGGGGGGGGDGESNKQTWQRAVSRIHK